MFIQEATSLTSCLNFLPIKNRLTLPERKTDTCVYILTDSFEYDIECIKQIPQPKMNYKNIIIPFKVNSKIAVFPFNYTLSQNEYNRHLEYLSDQKMNPQLNVVKYPYPRTIKDNLYITASDYIKSTTNILHKLSVSYIKQNIFNMFMDTFKSLRFSINNVLYIDTTKFRICSSPDNDNMAKTNIINALIYGYFNSEVNIPKIPMTIIFHGKTNDFKFDMKLFEERDLDRFQEMLDIIGTPIPKKESVIKKEDTDEETEDTIEKNQDVKVTKFGDNETEATDDNPSTSSSTIEEINSKVNAIRAKYSTKGVLIMKMKKEIQLRN